MIDELKGFIAACEMLVESGKQQGLIRFLAKHGPAMIAAVELAESFDTYEGFPVWDTEALERFQATKEPTND